jgi:hypothetical protein
MKESHRKGIANHPGPESCEGGREAALEALTGVYAGQVLNSEIAQIRGTTVSGGPEVNNAVSANASPLRPCGVEGPEHA